MTPAEQAALALWIEIEPYSHEPWASNDPGFAVKRICAAIEQARREGMEAAAKIADLCEDYDACRGQVAKVIRLAARTLE